MKGGEARSSHSCSPASCLWVPSKQELPRVGGRGGAQRLFLSSVQLTWLSLLAGGAYRAVKQTSFSG